MSTATVGLSDGSVSDKASLVFRYLKEVAELRSTTVRSVTEYEHVLWLSELPNEPEVFSVVAQDSGKRDTDDDWIEIRKPRAAIQPPQAPTIVLPWIDGSELADSELDEPELRKSITRPDDEGPRVGAEIEANDSLLFLENHPEVTTRWQSYVTQKWLPWAVEDRRRRSIQRVYDALFTIHQTQQRLGEQYEVVIGIGLLNWNPQSIRVQRHIVSAQAIVEFDAKRGHISVKASPEGARLQLEEDMLDPADRPPSSIQRQLQARLTDLDNAIWEPTTMAEILESWVNALSSSGSYDPGLEIVPYRGPNPLVTFGPALVLRRRSERSMIQMFGEISDQLQSGDLEVPLGIRRLVEVEDDVNYREGPESDLDGFTSSGEVYFPLLANGEQREIVERLSERQGVLVQGPPGTGKSHTIANLICHILANGQRVLVTSHTARALEVLKDKIPSQVADLCVSLLGDDRSAMKDLESSVAGITSRHGKWNPSASAQRVKDLEEAIAYNRSAAAQAINSLQQYRERETRHFTVVEGYSGTASVIAVQINAERGALGWVPDNASVDQPPPLSDDEFMELVSLIRHVSPDQQVQSRQPRLASSDVIEPEALEQLVATEGSIEKQGETAGFLETDSSITGARAASRTDRQAILEPLNELLRSLDSSGNDDSDWTQKARRDILGGRKAIWTYLADGTASLSDTISGLPAGLRSASLEGIGTRTLETVLGDLDPLVTHLSMGGSLGFSLFKAKEVKQAGYILDTVRLGGRKCDNLDTLQELRKWLDANIKLAQLRTLWADHSPVRSTTFEAQYLELSELGATIRGLLDLSQVTLEAGALASRIPQITITDWNNSCQIQQAIHTIKGSLWLDDLIDSRQPLVELQKLGEKHLLRNRSSHPSSQLLIDAINSRNVSGYRDAFAAILELERVTEAVNRAMTLGSRLASAAPNTARAVGETALQPVWSDRAGFFEKAWNWKRASSWLEKLSDPTIHDATQINLTQCQADIQSLLAELAAEKAWVHFFERLTERERQALGSWALSVRKLGKGTGKHASRHRAEARAAMDECRSAIPAWIMPMYRVAQSISPEPGIFDVVIIDEASQSGPDALFLQYIAKRIVVVGDDKQISPEAIGTQRSDVLALRDRYLKGVRNSVHLGVDNSLFDLASILFSGRIRLREHFRCMPEIIQFSNQLAYADDPLIPLKQFGINRLTPVRTTHVVDGYQMGSANNVKNPNEARAIAEEIKRCIALPEYNDLTIGVISLRGKVQAKEIEQRLLDTVGAEVMEERQIHCGDAYSFQGDERDIIFMSMVSSRADEKGGHGARIRALTSAADERRFNVAASRAREQMWLFHSVTLDDLSDRCLRYQLLDYCLAPRVASQLSEDIPEDAFDSPFEQAVYEEIRSRGYRVIPQYSVSNYRIDLVVEGMQGRLAVECDGDRWHGPDRYQADMERQRQLERCGWNFWRVRGSEFYRDRKSALASLWTVLDSHGIHPETADAVVTNRISQHDTVTIGAARKPVLVAELEETSWDTEETGDEEHNEDEAPELLGWGDVQLSVAAELEPFQAWEIRPLPRPESELLEDVGSGIVEIVLAEGPVLGARILKLYQRACGIREFGPEERQILTNTLDSLVQKGHLKKSEELGRSAALNSIFRHPNSPRVVERKAGNRQFDAIPPSELASVLMKLSNQSGKVERDRGDVSEFLSALIAIYDEHYMDWSTTQRRHLKNVINLVQPEAIGPLYVSIREHLAM